MQVKHTYLSEAAALARSLALHSRVFYPNAPLTAGRDLGEILKYSVAVSPVLAPEELTE